MQTDIREILFCPTLRCNLRCTHCAVNLTNSASDELTLEEIERIFSSELVGTADIIVSGGEPFLRKDIVEILEVILQRTGRLVKILTNGLYIRRLAEAFERLKPYRERIRVSISIDGDGPQHDAIRGVRRGFEIATDNIRMLQASGYDVHACSIVQKDNVDDIEALRERMTAMSIPVSFSPLMEYGRQSLFDDNYKGREATLWNILNATPANYAYVLNRGAIRISNCHAGLSNLYISPYGDVYECFVRLDIAGEDKGRIGSLREHDYDLDRLYSGFRPDARASLDCPGCCNESELIRESLYHDVPLPFPPQAYERLCGTIPASVECGSRSADKLLLHGWSYGEGAHRWMAGEAELFLRGRGSKLTYRALCAHPDIGDQPVILDILINGALADRHFFDASSSGCFIERSVHAPDLLDPDKPNRIGLRVNRTWETQGDDVRRRFGLAFERISLVDDSEQSNAMFPINLNALDRLEAARNTQPELFAEPLCGCPVCATQSHIRLNVDGFNYFQCGSCGLIFFHPHQAAAIFDGDFYRHHDYARCEDLWPQAERLRLFENLVAIGRDLHTDPEPTFLDLGAGIKDLEEKQRLCAPLTSYDPSFEHPRLTPRDELAAHYDVIICTEVIEHVADQQALFAGIASLLAPGSLCLATTLLHDYKFTLRYLSPHFGHIAVHSLGSLQRIAAQHALEASVQVFAGDDQYYYLLLQRI